MKRIFPVSSAVFGLAILITILSYLPGLFGGFVFDDSGVLTQNPAIRVSDLDFSSWFAAATSFGDSGVQSRWLGMLTFALNHYFTGMDPFWFKVTNLGIHLLNGFLLFLTLRTLFVSLAQARHEKLKVSAFSAMTAAVIAALWLVLPINLTGVLYVSQRLESLSHTFVFLGLWWYLRARLEFVEKGKGISRMWLALAVCTVMGAQVKEAAVMLPLYTFCIEFVLGGFKRKDGEWNRPILTLYGILLGLPMVAGLMWVSARMLHFDVVTRMMTEARVMFDYMHWTLLPNLDSLTLFHDDIVPSKGLLDPSTTLAAIVGIAALLAVALWQRKSRPMLALGILWFFSGHLLTGTVIPLILVFEHRNYFPSAGLLLSIAALIPQFNSAWNARAISVGTGCLFLFYAFTTHLRSMEWSSPINLAASDASKRPNSSASQYEYARILLTTTKNGDPEPMRQKAFAILERMAADPNAEATNNQLLIVYANELKRPVDPKWWDSMIAKFSSRKPTSTEATALVALLKCYDAAFCSRDIGHMRAALEAATSHSGGYAMLYAAFGRFAAKYLDNRELAELQFQRAIARAPSDPEYLLQYAELLIESGRFDEAESIIQQLHTLNRFDLLNSQLARIEEGLVRAKSNQTTH